jgi:glutathione S-transferase
MIRDSHRSALLPACRRFRYTTAEQFKAIKATGRLPFDQFPLLEIDGLVLTQSRACVSHLARIGGLYGDTDAEATAIDVVRANCTLFFPI